MRSRPAGEGRRALNEQRVDPLHLGVGGLAHVLHKCLAPRLRRRHADRVKWIRASAAGGHHRVPGTLAIFIAIGLLTILTPLAIHFVMGTRAARILDELKSWMAARNAAIMTVLLLVLGLKLIGDAIGELSA